MNATMKMYNSLGRLVCSGKVLSAANYGTDAQPDWYIEYQCDMHNTSHYLKQVLDGFKDAKIEVDYNPVVAWDKGPKEGWTETSLEELRHDVRTRFTTSDMCQHVFKGLKDETTLTLMHYGNQVVVKWVQVSNNPDHSSVLGFNEEVYYQEGKAIDEYVRQYTELWRMYTK